MKKTFLFILLLLCGLPSFAQKIHFTNNTNQWSMQDTTYGCCTDMGTRYTTTHYEGKVTYNGKIYQNLVYALGTCLVREEEGKVYVVGTFDSVEREMYDFNLKPGDTMRLSYPEDIYVSWVAGLDSTSINGEWYKVWYFEGTDYVAATDTTRTFHYNVIEGIGCTNGPYYPASPYSFIAFSEQLLCFKNDMGFNTGISKPVVSFGNAYGVSFDNNISCGLTPVIPAPIFDTSDLRASSVSVNDGVALIAPDPVTAASKLILPGNISVGNLVIYNSIGRVIRNIDFRNEGTLPIGDIAEIPGIYYYRVTDNATGKIFSGKFIH